MEISINPLMMSIGYLPINFRVALTKQIALGFHGYGHFFGIDETSVHGGGVGVSTKFFLSGNAISDSWYVEPQINVGYSKWGESIGFWTLSPAVIGGYTWVWDSGFMINLGLGFQYKNAFVKKAVFKEKETFGLKGTLPTGEFSLG